MRKTPFPAAETQMNAAAFFISDLRSSAFIGG